MGPSSAILYWLLGELWDRPQQHCIGFSVGYVTILNGIISTSRCNVVPFSASLGQCLVNNPNVSIDIEPASWLTMGASLFSVNHRSFHIDYGVFSVALHQLLGIYDHESTFSGTVSDFLVDYG